jgi:hypothetical protein
MFHTVLLFGNLNEPRVTKEGISVIFSKVWYGSRVDENAP